MVINGIMEMVPTSCKKAEIKIKRVDFGKWKLVISPSTNLNLYPGLIIEQTL